MSENEILPDNISDFINYRNCEKILFTAGPSSLTRENILGCGRVLEEETEIITNWELCNEKPKANERSRKNCKLTGFSSLH